MLITTYYFLLVFVCHNYFYDFLQYMLFVFLLALYANGITKGYHY